MLECWLHQRNQCTLSRLNLKLKQLAVTFYDKYNLIVRRVLDLNVSALCIITTTQFHVIDVLIYRLWTIWILTDVYLVEKILTEPKCKWFKNHSRFCGMLRSWGYFLQSLLKWPSWDMTTPRRQFSRSLANNRWVKVWRRWQRKDVIIVNENHRRYRALECIREGIKDMFEKHPELGVKVRVMSYCACYISGVMKVYRYIYCNRRERLVAGLGIWHESFLVRSSATELSRTWVVYSRVGDGFKIYILLYVN